MFWLRHPPYLRWSTAVLILMFGLAFDLQTEPTVSYPFAASPIAAGTEIAANTVWTDVPPGLLPTWHLPQDAISASNIAGGEPILPSHVGTVSIPDGWWSITISIPEAIGPGTLVRVVLGDGSTMDGVSTGSVVDDGYQLSGTIAFAPDDAPLVAQAAANSALVVMVSAGSNDSPSAG